MDIKTTPKTNDLVTTFTSVKRGTTTTTKGNYDFKLVVRALQDTIENLEFRLVIDHIKEVLGEAGTRHYFKDLNRHGEYGFGSAMRYTMDEVLGVPEEQTQNNFDLLLEYLSERAKK